MKVRRTAASTAVLGVTVVIVILVAAGAAFYLGQTATVTKTGGATTITVTSTSQVTSTVAASGPCITNQTLYQKARQDGTVYYYSSQTVEQLNSLKSLFETACPGITFQYQKLFSGPLVAALQNEFSSGKHVGDVVQGPVDGATTYMNNGWLDYYVPANPANIPSDFLEPKGYFTGLRAPYYVIAYNPVLVNQSGLLPKLPKSWMGLTDPVWKGKIAVADPYVATFVLTWYAAMKQVLGQNWTAFVNGIHNQNPILQPTNDLVAQLISNGQAMIGITLTSSMYPLLLKGAPIAPLAVGPIVSLPNGVMVVKGAPHPNAARLFVEWSASLVSLSFYSSFGDPTSNGLSPQAYSQLVPLAKYHTGYLTPDEATKLKTDMGLPWSQ